MPIKYTKLFHLLIDRDIKKGELQEKADITSSIMSRLGRNMTVRTDTIEKICKALDCQPGDIMEYVAEPEPIKKKSPIQKATDYFMAGYDYNMKKTDEQIKFGMKHPLKGANQLVKDAIPKTMEIHKQHVVEDKVIEAQQRAARKNTEAQEENNKIDHKNTPEE